MSRAEPPLWRTLQPSALAAAPKSQVEAMTTGAASAKADLTTELKRLGEAGYTRVWVSPGELADALAEQGLLTL